MQCRHFIANGMEHSLDLMKFSFADIQPHPVRIDQLHLGRHRRKVSQVDARCERHDLCIIDFLHQGRFIAFAHMAGRREQTMRKYTVITDQQ